MNFTFLQEQAYQYLREKIIHDELSYDIVYSEAQISKEIGCSRTPVKDALTRLRHDKYVDILPSKGFTLHKFTEDDIRSTFQARMALESFCAIFLMQARETIQGAAVINELHTIMDKQYEVVQKKDPSLFLPLDLAFHGTLVNFVENDDLHSLYESHNYRIEKLAAKSLMENGRCDNAYAEHLRIFMAIQNGGISDCYQAVSIHNESTYRCDLRILRQYSAN